MGNVFTELLWWVLAALVVGFAFGWSYWKGRVWFGHNADHERQVAALTANADRHEVKSRELSAQLSERDAAFASLEGRLGESDRALHELRTRLGELEGIETEAAALRSRTAELEDIAGEIDELRTRITELEDIETETNNLRRRLTELEGIETEATGLRRRITELEGITGEMDHLRTRVGQLESIETETNGLRAQIAELEALTDEMDGLRVRNTELEGIGAEATGLRRRIAELEALTDELDGLRVRNDELEGIETEANNLRGRISELEDMSNQTEGLRARLSELERRAGESESLRARLAEVERAADTADGLRARIAGLETENAEIPSLRSRIAELEEQNASLSSSIATTPGADLALDMSRARSVLGRRISRDDLTVVGGIGPKISGLLHDDGIATWRRLSTTTPDHIKGLLDAAGPRFQMHDPGTWPEQAELLADGRWEAFKELTDQLDGGIRVTGSEPAGESGIVSHRPELDLDTASSVLGFRLARDDLKVVEGIGPQIERLMQGAGIDTWDKLSEADTSVISGILDEAGPRFRIHDPGSWPQQAGLLAGGHWDDFKSLTDRLKGGRTT